MRNMLFALPLVAVASLAAAPAMAQPYWNDSSPRGYPVAAGVVAGAAVGTLAMVDAVFNPCAGFHALFDESHGQCVNGQYVGPRAERVSYEAPAPAVRYRHVRRHHVRHDR